MEILEYLVILVSFLCIIILLCQWSWTIISPITNWPLVGMLPGLLYKASRIHQYATHVLKQNGGTFEFKGPCFANMDILLTCDPINIRHISTLNFSNYHKGPEMKKIFDPFGDGLLTSDSDSWKALRKTLHSGLKDPRFELFLLRATGEKVTKGLIPVLEHVSSQGIVVDLQDVFQRFIFDNICLLVLGFDPKSLSVDLPEIEYRTAFDVVEEALFYRHIVMESVWKLQRWLSMGKEKKLRKAMELIDNFLEQKISSKLEQISRCQVRTEQIAMKEDDFDLITACIQELELDGGVLDAYDSKKPYKYLRDSAFNFVAAGKDNVSVSLTWLFWLVATNPSVEEKIVEEIKTNLKAKEDEKCKIFSPESLRKLVYLHGAILETLRLYPSTPFNYRLSVDADTLPSGHRVKANTKVMLSYYAMGSMEEIWGDDCVKFKPERWINSEGGGIIRVPSYKFTAFHTGPRGCIGKEATFIQMKIVAISVLWNYHVEVVEDHPVSPALSVVMPMKHGLKVRVTKRCAHD